MIEISDIILIIIIFQNLYKQNFLVKCLARTNDIFSQQICWASLLIPAKWMACLLSPMKNFFVSCHPIGWRDFNKMSLTCLNHREKNSSKRGHCVDYTTLKKWKTTVTIKHCSGSYSNNITMETKWWMEKIHLNAIWQVISYTKYGSTKYGNSRTVPESIVNK